MGLLLIVICIVLLVLAVQAIFLLFADGDLTLMWYERFGRKPRVLKGQVVWITGASSGIGRQLAQQLARVGCRLILSARSTSELENVRKECLTSGSLKEEDVLVLPLDITDTASHSTATEKVISTFGQIDVLINNAGRSQRAWVVDTELAVDREMIELNVIGQISLTKSVLPHMVKRRAGHIVVTSSLAGKMPLPFSATYCLTKFAINGYFHSLGVEMVPNNIAVTVACPGPVVSNLCNVAFTAKSGQMFGQSQENDRNRMTTSRCAELMTIAVANKLPEVWIARHPPLLFTYAHQYLPTLAGMVVRKIGVKQISAFREGK